MLISGAEHRQDLHMVTPGLLAIPVHQNTGEAIQDHRSTEEAVHVHQMMIDVIQGTVIGVLNPSFVFKCFKFFRFEEKIQQCIIKSTL